MRLGAVGMGKILIVASITLIPLSGCRGGNTEPAYIVATGGSAYSGKQLIHQYGCGSCHTIPGVRGARGMVGPPLISFGRRTFVAGHVPNSPDNLVRWIVAPQSIDAGTAMPTLGLTERQARDIAAYLYTLE